MSDLNEPVIIELCFCPPMADPSDPDQHRAGCYHAEVLYRRAFWDSLIADTANALAPPTLYSNSGRHDAPPPTSGCYEASFGWVHVKPGCQCGGKLR